VEKTIDCYMSLPYTVELEFAGVEYRASVKELLGCKATAEGSESVEERWRLLKEDQRKWIAQILDRGEEVPESPSANREPFWEYFEELFPLNDGEEVREKLYAGGATSFPLRVLQELWLRELEDAGLVEVDPSYGVPTKAQDHHRDQRSQGREGDMRPVRLGKSLNRAWIKFNGPRARRGYRSIAVFDKPLRTEAAIVAALTVLEASVIEDFDFDRLRDALLEYVKAHPEVSEKDLGWVLWRGLPQDWFFARKAENDTELKTLDERLRELKHKERKEETTPQEEKERKRLEKYLPKPSWRWARSPFLWRRSILYMMVLFAHRRPDFADNSLRKQIYLLDNNRKQINRFLKAQKGHMAFLEYGTTGGNPPRVVEQAQEQVRAAVLADAALRTAST
jgi:hypothetical protein